MQESANADYDKMPTISLIDWLEQLIGLPLPFIVMSSRLYVSFLWRDVIPVMFLHCTPQKNFQIIYVGSCVDNVPFCRK